MMWFGGQIRRREKGRMRIRLGKANVVFSGDLTFFPSILSIQLRFVVR
jgi:hypothetical protein